MINVEKPTPVDVVSALISLNYNITEHNSQRLILSDSRHRVPINKTLFTRFAEPILRRWLELAFAEQDEELLLEKMVLNKSVARVMQWLETPSVRF
ncbi:hypothetical protein GF359_08225 [candidate division WOR-3 bacterium]|uniref:Uncharacterized protein n=1 Tax=candidate division WOR-3 bacterium TaxID=2052148 RepID=A0A9D5QDK5_UNCW3|nr:hypothetical protein [candidate division WOR-3 bacterium]MBD3365187.1 hypothetical protein [candidate division WOR-3 bacterium]